MDLAPLRAIPQGEGRGSRFTAGLPTTMICFRPLQRPYSAKAVERPKDTVVAPANQPYNGWPNGPAACLVNEAHQ